jgi:hypothetical protein
MLMAYLTLITGLIISAVAIFYSVAGLATIFSAAVWPIIIMGTVLEGAKLVATVWLKQNWSHAPRFLKGYLLLAVAILMFITSMGIFGFLSKAHSDQTLVSGDVQSKIAIVDEKIKTERENIEAARRALTQMDAAVDQTMARSTNEQGANRAAQLRRQQAKERAQLQKDITEAQKRITALNDEAAPIRADLRKVEAEVGPIKYIASFIYGENPDANILEKAVTWVIILIVIVFDPLAVMLLLASQYTFAQLKKEKEQLEESAQEEPLTEDQTVLEEDVKTVEDPHKPGWPFTVSQFDERKEPTVTYQVIDDADEEIKEVKITHTENSIVVEDSAGTTEILAEKPSNLKDLIAQHGYTRDGGIFKVNGVDYTEEEFNLLSEVSYVQNEEQSTSSQWSKIVNRTITEEEYLQKANERQNKKDA